MIEDTIEKIESRIQSAETISEERRRELLHLLGTLKAEVVTLARTHGEDAQSIARFAAISALEATRETKNPRLLQLSLASLTSSVEAFEQSHPKLISAANAISRTLANWGI